MGKHDFGECAVRVPEAEVAAGAGVERRPDDGVPFVDPRECGCTRTRIIKFGKRLRGEEQSMRTGERKSTSI